MVQSRSSAFRLVYTLRPMKFLCEAEQKNTCSSGAWLSNLGFSYLNQQPVTSIAPASGGAFCDDVDFEPFTKHTPKDNAGLNVRVHEVRQQGYAHPWPRRVECCHAPARQSGLIVASVNISGPDRGF